MSQFQRLIFSYPEAERLARSILKENPAAHIHFEENGYSLEVPSEEAPDGFWKCFLKFDSEEKDIVESLCSCPEGEFCSHLATAACFVHPKHQLPLNFRFKESLWHNACKILFKHSYDLKIHDNNLQLPNSVPNNVFVITPKNLQALENLKTIYPLHEEQSKSLKNCWYLLSKILFFETWVWKFDENSDQLPLIVQADCDNYSVNFQVNPSLFCSLFTEHLEEMVSNLSILPKKTKIVSAKVCTVSHKLTYVWETALLDPKIKNAPYKALGNMKYISNGILILSISEEIVVSKNRIPYLTEEVRKALNGFIYFSPEAVPLHYEMFFSQNATLHRRPYLFTPGDLLEYGFVVNKHLVYLAPQRFYPIKGDYYPHSLSIKDHEIEHFLDTYGKDINTPGFQIHHYPNPRKLTFSVSPSKQILFYTEKYDEAHSSIYTFGKWIFYPNEGFFRSEDNLSPIRDGVILDAEKLTDVIEENRTTLESITGFFPLKSCPITTVQLNINRDDKNKRLLLQPIFLSESGEPLESVLFKNYIYIEQQGFYEIPETLAKFCTLVFPETIPYTEASEFLSLSIIQNHLHSNDISLKQPKNYSFLINRWQKNPGYIEINLDLKTDLGILPFKEIIKAFKKNVRFLFSKAGFLNLKKEPFLFLRSLNFGERYEQNANLCCITITDFLKLDALAPTSLSPEAIITDQNLEIFYQLKNFCLPQESDLSCVKHHLRAYQKNGLLWLWFLYKHGLSGMLCDEMGLGKTHQAVALMDLAAQSLIAENKIVSFLIACPTSVIPHWESVVKDYLPHLSVYVFHGAKRIQDSISAEVIITSYGTLRQNYPVFLNRKSPDIAIFDEIQIAKNKNSQVHKILARIDAHMKLGLTGTPIENNLSEFKNLLDIILPGYIPDPIFKELFLKPSNNSAQQKQELIRITRPFVLRRTKKQVLPELPDKIDISYPCQLSLEQEELYSQLLNHEKDSLIKELAIAESVIPYFHVFSILNQLKQICNHPAVYFKSPKEYKNHQSGKWELFLQILHEALDEGKKIVIFSQYLMMIEIFKLYFDEIGVAYASIQGKTRKRKEEIERFLTDPKCKIFVGSLLASGVGINLTAGSIVIMYDRWWNPAKENQALDRVHRIGQQNTVFIYKLISQNTIEERIDMLIQRKLELFQDFIPNEDANIIHMLNKDDLITLLSYKEDNL